MSVTLLRSSYDPDPLPEIGDHRWRFALLPCAGGLGVADSWRSGAAQNAALLVVGSDRHAGRLPSRLATGVVVEPHAVVLSQVKAAEDGDGLILRFQDCGGAATEARVTLASAVFGRVQAVEAVDLIERPLAGAAARLEEGQVVVPIAGHGLASVRIRVVGHPALAR